MKAKTSMAFDGLAGKAGEVVASNNKNRLYLKRRSIPHNPRTSAQMEARARLGDVSVNWSGLTEAQRTAWNEAAKNVSGKSSFGQKAQLSGANYYARINANLALIGVASIVLPLPEVEFPLLGIDGIAVAEGAVTIDLPAKVALTPYNIIIRATPVLRAGRTSMPNLLRIVDITDGTVDQQTVTISKTAYEEKFGVTLVAGDKIQVEFYIIDKASGQASLRYGGVYVL